MAGTTISGTVTNTVTLGSAGYASPLTIAGGGAIKVSAYAATALYAPAGSGSLQVDGAVTGGSGSAGNFAGPGGIGIDLRGGVTAGIRGKVSGGLGGIGVAVGGAGGSGVDLAAGAALTNQGSIIGGGGGDATGGSGATPGTGGAGVVLGGGSLTNSGAIGGGGGFGGGGYGGNGVALLGGLLSNTGTITGGSGASGGGVDTGNGVYLAAAATLINMGSIIGGHGQSFGGNGIFLAGGGSLSIAGHVAGGNASQHGGEGVYLAAGGTFGNSGTISGGSGGSGGVGVALANGGALANTADITGGDGYAGAVGIGGPGAGGLGGAGVVLAHAGMLRNTGAIAGGRGGAAAAGNGGNGGDGVDQTGGGTLSNDATATIIGGDGGSGSAAGGYGGVGASLAGTSLVGATLTSAGSMIGGNGGASGGDNFGGNGGAGVSLTAGARLTNSGHIAGGSGGYGYFGGSGAAGAVLAAGSLASTLVNTGIITGGTGGTVAPGGSASSLAYVFGGAGVSVAAGDTLTNAGSIAAGVGIVVGAAAAFTNRGHVYGGMGATVATGGTLVNTGSIVSGVGVALADGGTLTNAGLIAGGGYAGITATAVSFTGSGTLVIDPGARFAGDVAGNAAATDVLILASGSSRGALSGLGTQYAGFAQITIAAGAAWSFAGTDTIGAGATLTERDGASLIVSGTLVNDGAIMLDPSTLAAAGLAGSGSVIIDAGSMLELQGSVAGGETLTFSGSGASLHLDSPTEVAGSVANFAIGETIDLKGVDPASVSYADGRLSFAGGSIALSLARTGIVGATTSDDGAAVSVLCFCANTLILTPAGERPVQQLAVGDLVTTWRGEARPIVWVGVGKVLATRGRRSAATPVIVRKGALADNLPHHDLRVTKGHGIYLDGALIPVEYLVNHCSIAWDDRAQETELYHIELATHDILVANGAAAESYRDDGNRWLFRNANTGWGQPPMQPCVPVVTGGAVVDAAWRRLLDRAGPRPNVCLTDDPDLHLLVDGERVDGERVEVADLLGEAFVFHLPAVPSALRIVSRAAAPAELGLARDPRVLGAALRGLVVRQGTRFGVVDACDARLADGFHLFEADNGFRWTDGDAAIPVELFAGFSGPVELVLRVGGTAHYRADQPMRRAA